MESIMGSILLWSWGIAVCVLTYREATKQTTSKELVAFTSQASGSFENGREQKICNFLCWPRRHSMCILSLESFLIAILEGLIESSWEVLGLFAVWVKCLRVWGKRLRAWVRGRRLRTSFLVLYSSLVRHIVACTLPCSAARWIPACAGVFQVRPTWVSAAF